MNRSDDVANYQRASAAFDTITGASYYGFAFREVVAHNPEALAAAEKLAECLKAAKKIPGIE